MRAPDADRPGSFSGLADVYARFRPGYPRAAIERALAGLASPVRAVDVGCGTGISARLLAAHGALVTALDPNGDMLEQARATSSPDVRFLVGSAERTGLPDHAADVAVCAQSFHWFDPERALRELHRVLVPGGRLALMWNVRNAETVVGARYEAIIERARADTIARGRPLSRHRAFDLAGAPEARGRFDQVERHVYDNPHPLDVEALVGRARSASYFPREGALRDALEADLRRLVADHAEGGVVILPQRTAITVARRVPTPGAAPPADA